MFGLFKKKEKDAPAPKKVDAEGEEFRAFAAGFETEDRTVLVLTGPQGLITGKNEGDLLWRAGAPLVAWLEEDSPEVCREPTSLVSKGDETLMGILRQRIPRDFILKCKVRPSADGKRLLLLNLPEPGFDLDLKAILDESKKPVTLDGGALGEFTLNRSVGVFQKEADWLGQSVQLTFDRDEDQQVCLSGLQAMVSGQAEWDGKLREFAAAELLDLANDWAADADEEEVSLEDFMQRIEPDTLAFQENGTFDFWFNDGELFFGHAIRVSGTLEGPTSAEMEG